MGALGSALWDFSKPLLSSFTVTVANFSTLGLEALRDAFYAGAARSLGRPIGVGFSMTLVLTFLSALSAATFHVVSFSKDPEVSRWARKYMMLSSLVAFVFFAQLTPAAYVLQLANYYELLEVRAAPYISDAEIKQTRALFAQVQTKKEFLKVTEGLSSKIRAAGEAPPIVP